MKVKDLKFIDIGLPSGNKLCVDLLDNLYRVKDFDAFAYLLPTKDELKELLLFCSFNFTSMDIDAEENDEASEELVPTIKGLRVFGSNNNFFLPFLGILRNNLLQGEYIRSEILTQDREEEDKFEAVAFTKDEVSFEGVHLDKDDYIQILLIQRNGKN